MATREICKCCWQINPLGFHVPNDIWESSVPIQLKTSVLCVICFARFADENDIQWDTDIDFYPVSKVTHNMPL
jgi:hypothetical protein